MSSSRPHKLNAIHRNIDFGARHLEIHKTNRKRRMKNWIPLLSCFATFGMN